MASVKLTGKSGRQYEYVLCVVNKPWINRAGNYAFLNRDNWPVYVGESGDFSTRMPSHPMWPMAQMLGAVTIWARQNPGGEAVRKAEERDLIQAYNPICNTQHKHPAAVGLADLFAPAPQVPGKGLLGGR